MLLGNHSNRVLKFLLDFWIRIYIKSMVQICLIFQIKHLSFSPINRNAFLCLNLLDIVRARTYLTIFLFAESALGRKKNSLHFYQIYLTFLKILVSTRPRVISCSLFTHYINYLKWWYEIWTYVVNSIASFLTWPFYSLLPQ